MSVGSSISFHINDKNINPLLLVACNYKKDFTDLSYAMSNRFWILDYSFVDCGIYRVGSKYAAWQPRLPHSAHLYPPETIYWEDTRQTSLPLHSAYFVFRGGEQLGLQHYTDNTTGFGCFEDCNGNLGQLLLQMCEEIIPLGDNGFWRAQSWLYLVVDMLYSSIPGAYNGEWLLGNPNNPAAVTADDELVKTVKRLLREHPDCRISLPEIAKKLGVSTSTLSHKYRSITGESPFQTLTGIRLNTVKSLLSRGMTMKSIAAQTGFYDEFHLSKMFKKQTGMSPREYLKHL